MHNDLERQEWMYDAMLLRWKYGIVLPHNFPVPSQQGPHLSNVHNVGHPGFSECIDIPPGFQHASISSARNYARQRFSEILNRSPGFENIQPINLPESKSGRYCT